MSEPIWRNSCWVGLFADPFVDGTQLEGGKIADSLLVLSYMFRRLLSDRLVLQRRLPFLEPEKLQAVKDTLDQCLESVSATEDVEDAAGLELVLADFLERLQGLAPGGTLLVPGGWKGLTSVGSVMYIVERGSGDC